MPYTFQHGDRPLDGITIQRAVGRGGFGEVYYALTDSGKQVALKYLRDNPEVELRGIANVLNLKSPHLITIYDVRRDAQDEPFVVMEYVGGPSLRELLNASPSGLGAQRASYFLVGIAKGLSYLHERGIVHRDLKPANIFYDDGYVKIGDYGLSKHIAVSRHSAQTVSVGTVHYMAPEIGSGSYTKAIDIYALGVMLYEMLTGRLPFHGASMGEILMRHANERPDLAGLPEPFATVIGRALVKDPGGRWSDVNAMADALTDVLEVSESLRSFDPASLSSVPRDANADDADRTMTRSPGRRPPYPMDAGAVGRLPPLPPVAPIPAGRDGAHARRAARLRRHAQRHAARAHALSTRLAKRAGWRRPGSATRASEARRGPQIGTLVILGLALSAGLGLLVGRVPEGALAVGLFLAGGVAGPLLAYFGLLRRQVVRNGLVERAVYAGAAALGMVPATMFAHEEINSTFSHMVFVLAAVVALCDWHLRIEEGRLMIVNGQRLVMPAIVALIGASIFDADRYIWTAAGMGAALSLLTVVAAGGWPLAATAPEGAHAPAGASPPDEGDSAPTPPPSWSRHGARSSGAERAPAVASDVRPSGDQPAAPVIADVSQPSFVGRTTDAGMSFAGKLMLMLGFLMAFGYHGHFESGAFELERGRARVGQHEFKVPRGVVLIPFTLGTLLVIYARRRSGGAHLVRAALGCGLFLAAGVLALGPGRRAALDLVGRDAFEASIRHFNILIALLGVLALAAILLAWPAARRKRADRPMML
jgi:hypothetical protein